MESRFCWTWVSPAYMDLWVGPVRPSSPMLCWLPCFFHPPKTRRWIFTKSWFFYTAVCVCVCTSCVPGLDGWERGGTKMSWTWGRKKNRREPSALFETKQKTAHAGGRGYFSSFFFTPLFPPRSSTSHLILGERRERESQNKTKNTNTTVHNDAGKGQQLLPSEITQKLHSTTYTCKITPAMLK